MKNIWEFLLQNISVSLVASFLLIIKAVFKISFHPVGNMESGVFWRSEFCYLLKQTDLFCCLFQYIWRQ